ncbi:MAG: TPM domain-containing protein, partial [Syntrophomonadaceae bacterium]|nr:TPM domain-containing protein [Syntrophomonadaceae bacterium]
MLGLITFCLGTISNGLNAASPIPSPPATFYVLDEAQVISSQVEDLIISVNQDLAKKTKAQIVVVTLKSSEDRPLEELGLGILRDWGVGDRELNNGLVMLVIPEERKSRIEVGYGLEGALPDGKTGRIQDDYMIPYFKQND